MNFDQKGRFFIDAEILVNDLDSIKDIFGLLQIVVLDARYDILHDRYEYGVVSPFLPEVVRGEIVPFYVVHVETDEEGKPAKATFKATVRGL